MRDYFNNYQNFPVERFAARGVFQKWEITPERRKKHFLEVDLCLHPAQRNRILAVRKRVKGLSTGLVDEPLSLVEKKALKEELFRYIDLNAFPAPSISDSRAVLISGNKS